MLNDWKFERGDAERDMILKNTRISIYLSYAIAACYNGLVFSYLAIAVMSYKNSENIDDRQFVMQANFPINAKESPVFETICVVQFITAFFATNGHTIIEGLLTVSVSL